MRRKRKLIIGLLIITIVLEGIVIIKLVDIPKRIGMAIVNDGAAPDTSGDTSLDNSSDEAAALPTKEPAKEQESSVAASDSQSSTALHQAAEDATVSTEDASISAEAASTSAAEEALTARITPNAASQDTEEELASVSGQEESEMFFYEELSQEVKDRITGVSYSDSCDVPYEELRYVSVLYWGFDDKTHTGELIVNKGIAEDIVDIFKELYDQKYPIEQMVLVDEYDADDEASMAADNTSSFNYRFVPNEPGNLSNHSYGIAIDVNPRYNPYVREVNGETVISPDNAAEYADRSQDCKYYIKKGDACYQAFISRGFTWGGDWRSEKDYQHFQKELD